MQRRRHGRVNAVDRLVDGLAPRDRVVLVVAHPDDETIGCGAHLSNWADAITIVHVTDGAPPDDSDARAAGCATPAEYAALRRRELHHALAIASVGPERLVCLDVGDQRAVRNVASIASRLARVFIGREATIVVTQPYEG